MALMTGIQYCSISHGCHYWMTGSADHGNGCNELTKPYKHTIQNNMILYLNLKFLMILAILLFMSILNSMIS